MITYMDILVKTIDGVYKNYIFEVERKILESNPPIDYNIIGVQFFEQNLDEGTKSNFSPRIVYGTRILEEEIMLKARSNPKFKGLLEQMKDENATSVCVMLNGNYYIMTEYDITFDEAKERTAELGIQIIGPKTYKIHS